MPIAGVSSLPQGGLPAAAPAPAAGDFEALPNDAPTGAVNTGLGNTAGPGPNVVMTEGGAGGPFVMMGNDYGSSNLLNSSAYGYSSRPKLRKW